MLVNKAILGALLALLCATPVSAQWEIMESAETDPLRLSPDLHVWGPLRHRAPPGLGVRVHPRVVGKLYRQTGSLHRGATTTSSSPAAPSSTASTTERRSASGGTTVSGGSGSTWRPRGSGSSGCSAASSP